MLPAVHSAMAMQGDDGPQTGHMGSTGSGVCRDRRVWAACFDSAFVYDDRWTVVENLPLDALAFSTRRHRGGRTVSAQGIPDATRPAMIASLPSRPQALRTIARLYHLHSLLLYAAAMRGGGLVAFAIARDEVVALLAGLLILRSRPCTPKRSPR